MLAIMSRKSTYELTCSWMLTAPHPVAKTIYFGLSLPCCLFLSIFTSSASFSNSPFLPPSNKHQLSSSHCHQRAPFHTHHFKHMHVQNSSHPGCWHHSLIVAYFQYHISRTSFCSLRSNIQSLTANLTVLSISVLLFVTSCWATCLWAWFSSQWRCWWQEQVC